jgi:hypothetical protein
MEEELQFSTIDQEKEGIKRTESKLSGLIKEVVDEINFLRTQPNEYLKKLKELKKLVSPKENILLNNNKEILVIPNIEQQFDDLIKKFASQTQLEALNEDEFLTLPADELISVIQKYEKKEEAIIANYIIDFPNRFKKHGIISGAIGEIIDIGVNDNSELIVLKILLDQDKSEQEILLSDKVKYFGGSFCYFGFLDNIVVTLNFSEKQSVKQEKSIINLNNKIIVDRLGRQVESSKIFLIKKKIVEEDKSIINSKLKNAPPNKNLFNTPNRNKVPQIANPHTFKQQKNMSKNIKIPTNKTITIESEQEQKDEEDPLKTLKISNDTLLKASHLMKKMPARINYNNTKIVNINVNIDNERIESKTNNKAANNDKKGKNLPYSTKSTNPSQNFKNDLKHNFDEILLSDDSHGDHSDLERKNKFKAQTIDNNAINNQQNPKIRKGANRSTVIEESRKLTSDVKQSIHRASSGSKNNDKAKMIDYTDKKTFDKEILSNKSIKCMKINKTIGTDDDGKEFYIIKKTIFYNNNSTDEWIFKEEI